MLGVPFEMWVLLVLTTALSTIVYIRLVLRWRALQESSGDPRRREADRLWQQLMPGEDFTELNALLHEAEWEESQRLRNATEDYLLAIRHAGGIGLSAAKLSGTDGGASWLELTDGKKLKLEGILFGITGVHALATQAVSESELIELRDISRHANVWQLLLACGEGHALLVVNTVTVIDGGPSIA